MSGAGVGKEDFNKIFEGDASEHERPVEHPQPGDSTGRSRGMSQHSGQENGPEVSACEKPLRSKTS
jgi:hypothetical protein